MVPSSNGFTMGDRSRMMSSLASPPTPDDQREAVAEAMKIEMREGQVREGVLKETLLEGRAILLG